MKSKTGLAKGYYTTSTPSGGNAQNFVVDTLNQAIEKARHEINVGAEERYIVKIVKVVRRASAPIEVVDLS